jgi:hypothetical protein
MPQDNSDLSLASGSKPKNQAALISAPRQFTVFEKIPAGPAFCV